MLLRLLFFFFFIKILRVKLAFNPLSLLRRFSNSLATSIEVYANCLVASLLSMIATSNDLTLFFKALSFSFILTLRFFLSLNS